MRGKRCRRVESNHRPRAYESLALPLSYVGEAQSLGYQPSKCTVAPQNASNMTSPNRVPSRRAESSLPAEARLAAMLDSPYPRRRSHVAGRPIFLEGAP